MPLSDELSLTSSATELTAAIRTKQISSRELLDAYLARVDRLNPSINAVITLDGDRARAAADAADAALARGELRGPLHGLPITIKDAIATEGLLTTGGAVELADHVPTHDAPAVSRLKAAGAIVFAKTNLPRWSSDITTSNELFGTTNNPWDLGRVPGGSSGGAAAAISAGLTGLELGTDIGGSVRIPAHCCGVFSHKPSFGLVSQLGYVDYVGAGDTSRDINVFGPIARSVDDLELALDVVRGADPHETHAITIDPPPPRHRRLSEYRVGLWLDDPACRVSSVVKQLLDRAASTLGDAGARVADERPAITFDEGSNLFFRLITSAMGLTTPDGPGAQMTIVDWLRANDERAALRAKWQEFFTRFDVLLCPVMGVPAPVHDDAPIMERKVVIDGQERSLIETVSWAGLIGVAYLPSTVVPVGLTDDGLPVGMQIVGPYLEDRTSLWLAARLAELTGGYQVPPIAR